MLVLPIVKFQMSLARNIRRRQAHDRLVAAGKIDRHTPPPKGHKGAAIRWQTVVRNFWAGGNIYKEHPEAGESRLHPNMPFVVVLLTPFAYLQAPAAALAFNLLKVVVLVATLMMTARVAGHGSLRAADWVMALGLLWSAALLIGDIQHANTNCFALGAIVLHLWLYRRGQDVWAGVALALAVCLKLTPGLFLLYWLYQRNWKLLVGAAAGGIVMAVVIPAALVGPAQFTELAETYVSGLILPASAGGQWYPIHINQSLSGVISRYFLAGPNGDVFWNPDDHLYGQHFQQAWITVWPLRPETAGMLLRLSRLAVGGLAAWAIGWRRLSRDDGRRMLHYGLIVLGMMLLNQRTWDHHAAVIFVAHVAVWQALATGRMSRKARVGALVPTVLAGLVLLATRGDAVKTLAIYVFGQSEKLADHTHNLVEAYGPTCMHFLLVFAAAVICARALRGIDAPYAPQRQKVFS